MEGVTLNKLAYDLLLTVRGGTLSDDENIDLRQVKYWINNHRAFLIKNSFKGREISDNVIQDLGCVELERADPAECCGYDTGCTVFRTKLEIPNPVKLNSGDAITHVGWVDKMAVPLTYVSYERAIYSGNGAFNGNLVYAFMLNSHIYLKMRNTSISYKGLKYINIRGVFQTPEEVANFNHCSGESCYTDDDNYPVDSSMVSAIKELALTKDFRIIANAPQDIANDANDQPVQ